MGLISKIAFSRLFVIIIAVIMISSIIKKNTIIKKPKKDNQLQENQILAEKEIKSKNTLYDKFIVYTTNNKPELLDNFVQKKEKKIDKNIVELNDEVEIEIIITLKGKDISKVVNIEKITKDNFLSNFLIDKKIGDVVIINNNDIEIKGGNVEKIKELNPLHKIKILKIYSTSSNINLNRLRNHEKMKLKNKNKI